LWTFLLGIPTWGIIPIKDNELYFLIYDLSFAIPISFIPLMGYLLLKPHSIAWLCLAYFYLTLTNVLSIVFDYFNYIQEWMITIKIAGAMIILIFFLIKVRKYGYR
jgi:hypothetical protein